MTLAPNPTPVDHANLDPTNKGGLVAQLGYVALRTHELTASIRYAEEILGVRLVENTGNKAYLAAADTHHELVYIQDEADGVDHFGVIAASLDDYAAIRAAVDREGWPVFSDGPLEIHADTGFAFVGPEGYAWHVYLPTAYFDARVGGFGPDRYGHINFRVRDSIRMRDFLIRVFGMRVSDQIGVDAGFFMRCNSDHHGIAVIKSDKPKMHHHAWQTQSVVDLGRMGDRLAARHEHLVWGPVRHGAGHNIAVYCAEPSGGVIELYTDMEQIFNDDRPPTCWGADDPWWYNQWDGHRPSTMDTFGHQRYPREAALPYLDR